MSQTSDDVQWYREKRQEYEDLAERVATILDEILNIEKTNYAVIQSRAKTIESFENRLKEINYSGRNLVDLAGIRVVGYVRSDVKKIIQIIKNNFEVDKKRSKDKSAELDTDRFGYRAIHLICQLPKARIVLPEYRKFKDMTFEIQIKTILDHAWAEIEHDRNYKYHVLPNDIQRDFFQIAGSLEGIDKQFEQITKRIEKYDRQIKQKTKLGKLDEIDINPATLKLYLIDKFSKKLEFSHSYGFNQTGESEVQEIIAMGITSMSQLDKIVPNNFIEVKKIADSMEGRSFNNLASLIYAILILKYRKKYFDIASKHRAIPKEKFDEKLNQYSKAVSIQENNHS